MRPSPKPPFIVLAILLATAFVVATTETQASQEPQGSASNPSPASLRTYPAPTNLRVLPKNTTGQQVHNIMVQWSAELGVECSACHATDSSIVITSGPPHSRFAEDSKAMKQTARLMYIMTEQINTQHIAKVEGSGMPVTCGTCHRGHVGPQPFSVQPADEQLPIQNSQK